MSTNTPQTEYQPAIGSNRVLRLHDALVIGITNLTTIYTAPDRTRITLRWFTVANRGSGGAARDVSVFVTAPDGVTSPRIFHKSIAENATEHVIPAGCELVIAPKAKIEMLSSANTVTADLYLSGSGEHVPS